MSEKKSTNENAIIIAMILALIGALALLFQRYFSEYRKNTEDEFITEEGKEILESKEKREKLNNAIDQYKENGNWNGLDALKT